MRNDALSQGTLSQLVRATVLASTKDQVYISQAMGISQKHLSMMLIGRSRMSLDMADRILAVCGKRLALHIVDD